jgi:hypothetical protein
MILRVRTDLASSLLHQEDDQFQGSNGGNFRAIYHPLQQQKLVLAIDFFAAAVATRQALSMTEQLRHCKQKLGIAMPEP